MNKKKKRVQKRDASMYWPGNVRVSNQLVAAFQQQSSNHRKRLDYYHPKKKPHLHLHSSGKNLIPTYLCVFLVHTEALLEHHARFEDLSVLQTMKLFSNYIWHILCA